MKKFTYAEIAAQLRQQFTRKKPDSCKECGRKREPFYCFADKALGLGGKGYPDHHEELSNLIHMSQVSVNYAYEFVVEALNAISDLSNEATEDELDEFDMPEECHTSELMKFLSDGNQGYIEDAVSEMAAETWPDMLNGAYYIAQREVKDEVVRLVKEIYDEQEDEE